jgi:hypothetical protein
VALGNFHSSETEWYKKGQIKKIYDLYKGLVDSFSLPKSLVLTTCCQCHIEFLTSSSNRGRRDIRCPFGCRQDHKKKKSNERSRAYYQTPEGKIKKQKQNSKRKKSAQNSRDQKLKPIPEDLVKFLSLFLTLMLGEVLKKSELYGLVIKALKVLRQHTLETLADDLVLTGYG